MQATGESPTALGKLHAAMPTDSRGWWIGEEVDRFIGTWQYLGLPELTLHDATGKYLTLWIVDLNRAHEMLHGNPGPPDLDTMRMTENGYEVCVVRTGDVS